MVWLIVTQADAESMVAAMTAAYNAPSRRNDEYVAFEPYRAAWRYHPAEILFWAPEMDRELDENFR